MLSNDTAIYITRDEFNSLLSALNYLPENFSASNDTTIYVTRNEFNSRMNKQEQLILSTAKEQKELTMSTAKEIYTELSHTNDKIEWIQTTIYWGFAIVSIVIALAALLRRERKEYPAERSEKSEGFRISDILALINFIRDEKGHEK